MTASPALSRGGRMCKASGSEGARQPQRFSCPDARGSQKIGCIAPTTAPSKIKNRGVLDIA